MRLGLTSLAYLWHQPQAQLLQGMIQAGIEAILVKVAVMGLTPRQHLGCTLAEIEPVMHRLSRQVPVLTPACWPSYSAQEGASSAALLIVKRPGCTD